MLKVAVIDDTAECAEMSAAILRRAGHRIYVHAAGQGPIDFEALIAFGPQVVTLCLYRHRNAFDRPLMVFEADVLGAEALGQFEHYPAIQILPLLLIGHGIEERHLPAGLHYDGFLLLPEDSGRIASVIEGLASKPKTRRKLSLYACPRCRSRLTYTRSERDLFCPACGTVVAIVDSETCIYSTPENLTDSNHCLLADLAPSRKPDGGG